MTHRLPAVTSAGGPSSAKPVAGTYAPLTNVALTRDALERAQSRTLGLPGIVVLHGPSGYGKSTAATFANIQLPSYYVTMYRTWDWRDLVDAIVADMKLVVKGRTSKAVSVIGRQLADSGSMLFIDEAHVLAKSEKGRGLIWDLHEASNGVILLIGEEILPQRLEQDEFLHGRVREWIGAQPASVSDARTLTQIYCTGVQVGDDLLRAITETAAGSVRRIVVNLDRVRKEAKSLGWTQVDLALWGERELYTGKTPDARFGYGGRKPAGGR